MPVISYIFKRFLQTIPLLLIVSIMGFFLIKISPVDPLAELRMNPSISKQTLEAEKIRLGLDKPIIVQYGLWLKSFVKGDMGICTTGEKVSDKLKERIPNTLLLTVTVIFFTWLCGIPLGIVAALNKGRPLDRLLTVISSIGMAIPSFFFALLMLIFAVKTGWFPTGGLTSYNFDSLSTFGKAADIAKQRDMGKHDAGIRKHIGSPKEKSYETLSACLRDDQCRGVVVVSVFRCRSIGRDDRFHSGFIA